jgi:TolA-binding protein
MKKNTLLVLISFLLTLTSCKTQEDIKRDRTVDNINEQLAQTQKSTATSSSRFQSLEEQVARISGNIEEVAHARNQDQKELANMREKLSISEETNKKQTEMIKELYEKMQEQSKYLEQVIKSLSGINEQVEKKVKAKEPKEPTEEISLQNGLVKYKAKEYETAKMILEKVLENKKIKKKDKGTALQALGLIEYKNKNYEEAKIYFSRIFTEMPDSNMAPAALLNLAKCFLKLKAKPEAKQTIEELVSRFPKSKEAIEAQKLK